MDSTLHEVAIYLRLMAYLFLTYSMFTLAIARWTSNKGNAFVHMLFATMFLVGAAVIIIPRVTAIPDWSALFEDIVDFLVTPILIIGTAVMWRIMLGDQKKRIERIENRINKNNENGLAHN